VGQRYLFGDSEDFPGGTDFLTELRQFVAAASKALALAHEADELERGLVTRGQEHTIAVETLFAFFDGISATISERAANWANPHLVAPYAVKLIEAVASIGHQARAGRTQELDSNQAAATARIEECRAKMREALEEYFIASPVPVTSWGASLSLLGDEPLGDVLIQHPSELTTSFAVDVAGDTTWGRPRKLGDVEKDLTLQVGFKKAFLRSALQPDMVELDDQVISTVKIGPEAMEVRLRKKPDAPRDQYVISLARDDNGVPVAQVMRFGESGEGGERFTSPPEERAKIEALADKLRRECAPLLQRKKRLIFAQLAGQDVFERGVVHTLLERFIDRMAPIAEQVARHSPNPHELSLKLEREDGRREELYLRKAELRQLVAPLPPSAQSLFQRLGFLERSGRPSTVPPPPKRPL
jgi:hypothetical protein